MMTGYIMELMQIWYKNGKNTDKLIHNMQHQQQHRNKPNALAVTKNPSQVQARIGIEKYKNQQQYTYNTSQHTIANSREMILTAQASTQHQPRRDRLASAAWICH